VFSARFLIEFVKTDQKAFESSLVLNMGQLLSIPFVLAGLYFLLRGKKNEESGRLSRIDE
ncbi:prolipoprotein diacylglyceryl transferase, partial [Flavisolibacter sp. BT320]|nr:prolipoprotein diacylglyceryl transferase [Flavisolibacter longurius]